MALSRARSEATKRVLLCFDSFKGSLTAEKAGCAVAEELEWMYGEGVRTMNIPLTDGGDGFLSCLQNRLGLKTSHETVTGPLGKPISAPIGWSTRDDGTAFLETATAIGLDLVPLSSRNPINTTSRGIGELILATAKQGAKKIVIGMGGSATHDAGLGCLQALGLQVRVQEKGSVDTHTPDVVYGSHLLNLHSLRLPLAPKRAIKQVELELACDISNSFCGPDGAVAYAKQKGANKETIEKLLPAMDKVASMYHEASGIDLRQNILGTGAGGGLAGALHAMLGAKVIRGTSFVATTLELESAIKEADLIITGEGCYDEQTERGKAVSYVCDLAKKHGKAVSVICGSKNIETTRVHVLALQTLYHRDLCIRQPEKCLKGLIRRKSMLLPVIKELKRIEGR